MSFKLTSEQTAIVSAYADTTDNLLIRARAGAAKTSTLTLMAEAVNCKTLCLAFNKSIATEMTERMPAWVESRTLSALGYRVWASRLNRRLKMNDNKLYRLLANELDTLTPAEQVAYRDIFRDLLTTLEQMKTLGVCDSEAFPRATPLVTLDDFFTNRSEFEFTQAEMALLTSVYNASMKLGFKGEIDFADMVLLPALFSCQWPVYSCVMVDEAQDLSPLNHVMLQKLTAKPSTRLIVVGDDLQAIYGWRGADTASLSTLASHHTFVELKLTTSFRCPVSVIREAQTHAEDIRAWDQSDEGEVTYYPDWDPTNLPPGSTIICRNNSPLFSLAIWMLTKGVYAKLVGNDLALQLKKTMAKLGKPNSSRQLALSKLSSWESREKSRSRNKSLVEEKATCMRLFLRNTETLGDAQMLLEKILSSTGSVSLMTGHRAKGLEFPHVYFYKPELINREDSKQEANLFYVIQTRALRSLNYVNDSFRENENENT